MTSASHSIRAPCRGALHESTVTGRSGWDPPPEVAHAMVDP
jgi:hypothetical protein